MKLTTIWMTRGLYMSERFNRTADLVAQKVASALPARVRYWTFIHVGVRAIPDSAIVPEILFMDVLKNAEGGPK